MIGERLKAVRKAKGITQRELAQLIGVSEGAVKTWEQETSEPTAGALVSIAVALGVSIDYIVGRDVPMDLVVDGDEGKKRIFDIVNELPEHHKQALLQYAELLKGGKGR